MLRILVLAALVATPVAAVAQTESSTVQRVRSVTLKPGEKCPASSAEEIVVCGTIDQPYRIPKQFRNDGPIAAQNQSWVNRADTMTDVSRVAGGLPDTCSTVGSGGQTGCALATNRAWRAEKRAQAQAATSVP